MAHTISATVVKKVLSVKRVHHSLVSTPGLQTIIDTAIGEMQAVSTYDELVIARACELAWLEGASLIASMTEPLTLSHRLPS